MIFLGGIHGVGKSYFSALICKRFDIPTFTASKLIEKRIEASFGSLKAIDGIDKNQYYLIQEINRIRREYKLFLLDGHCCILNKDMSIKSLGVEIFRQLRPWAMIILYDQPESISARLFKRDQKEYAVDLLVNFQAIEIDTAENISKELNIPLFLHSVSDDVGTLFPFVENLIKRGG